MYEHILVEQLGAVGLVRLNRPKAFNALSLALMTEVADALSSFDQNPEVRVLVLTGNEKAFAAGADITEMQGKTAADMLNNYRFKQWETVRKVSKPLIAAVSGFCLGGGNELAMSCDMIFASESAQFGQPEINLGIIPGAGGTQRLVKAVGKSLAMEMILNDRRLTASEALQFGLISRVFPVERYLDETLRIAAQMAERSPFALRLAKQSVLRSQDTTLEVGLDLERHNFYLLFATEDQKEGVQAFIDKRKPEFKGR